MTFEEAMKFLSERKRKKLFALLAEEADYVKSFNSTESVIRAAWYLREAKKRREQINRIAL